MAAADSLVIWLIAVNQTLIGQNLHVCGSLKAFKFFFFVVYLRHRVVCIDVHISYNMILGARVCPRIIIRMLSSSSRPGH